VWVDAQCALLREIEVGLFQRAISRLGRAGMLGDGRLAPQSNSAPSSGPQMVVENRKEGIVAKQTDRFFSGNRVLKESRDSQGQGRGHVGVPTFVEASQCGGGKSA
jgi:hypothetical protein